MSSEDIVGNRNPWEMTAIPGGIIEWVDSQAAAFLLEDLPIIRSVNLKPPQNLSLLTDPIKIDSPDQGLTLTYKPLSYEYQQQIMSFNSAYTPLLQFLQTDAFLYEEIGNTCTTLFFESNANELVGFCSTKCSSLKIKGRKIISLCPSVEIAALCIDDHYRYLGIGQAIFNHTIQQIYKIKTMVGVQFITLFSLPEAVAFYQKFGFRRLEKKGMKVLYTSVHECCIPMYFPLPHIPLQQRYTITTI
ncbi:MULTISPECIES: GNAT family N-acetyltransferase [Pelosinus]|uniref:GCN5-related N-acetyltransferase n=1 Tax=Pelosinus fermentans B4 TaxID=1149862 RepID=I8RDG3_9FIRM|nr:MULTISPECIES: GNAT family N-acetyltransferase [Pelosinus]EIW15485.1 GCN5-related N-acetyltransferase [Pelosinus fermentans B4]EIW26824.1 GCN5-related N-acetyltransferase [Pelosinus fermentans A11]OAM92227.1 GCN5-related N-acetyltransferase [Pelosinus fermentans DSM 17108]SDQ37560.1 Acetyltransferase (GNAT) domain-containing protein [Pelosinus fermentans]